MDEKFCQLKICLSGTQVCTCVYMFVVEHPERQGASGSSGAKTFISLSLPWVSGGLPVPLISL